MRPQCCMLHENSRRTSTGKFVNLGSSRELSTSTVLQTGKHLHVCLCVWQRDEDGSAQASEFFREETFAGMIGPSFDWPARSAPGSRHIYHTTLEDPLVFHESIDFSVSVELLRTQRRSRVFFRDTFVLTVAMQRILKARGGLRAGVEKRLRRNASAGSDHSTAEKVEKRSSAHCLSLLCRRLKQESFQPPGRRRQARAA